MLEIFIATRRESRQRKTQSIEMRADDVDPQRKDKEEIKMQHADTSVRCGNRAMPACLIYAAELLFAAMPHAYIAITDAHAAALRDAACRWRRRHAEQADTMSLFYRRPPPAVTNTLSVAAVISSHAALRRRRWPVATQATPTLMPLCASQRDAVIRATPRAPSMSSAPSDVTAVVTVSAAPTPQRLLLRRRCCSRCHVLQRPRVIPILIPLDATPCSPRSTAFTMTFSPSPAICLFTMILTRCYSYVRQRLQYRRKRCCGGVGSNREVCVRGV